jgi:hypothetical protein
MRRFELLTVLLAVAAGTALGDDPPSRVARLNYQTGSVSFRPGNMDQWSAASLNYPLTAGDHLWTDANAQAELHIGSTAVRMNSQTALAFLNLDDRTVQLSLTQGSLSVHLRALGQQEVYEVDTPNMAISLLRPGEYRIDADGDRSTTVVTVRGGEAEATGGGTAFPIRAQEQVFISGTDTVGQQINPAPPPDGWDTWCSGRDQREDRSQSTRYVSPETIGYEDLDQYGQWRNVPPYGPVWIPAGVPPGWAPYHYGHWVWVEPWGWTWIDDAPWGFAPFHYGRWALVGGVWVWVPGAIAPRPVYAPALVAFVGGPGFSLAITGGAGVGWFPLGPGEVYRPAYAVSPVYVQQINITHVSSVTVINSVNVVNVRYVNQTVPGAITVVPQAAFVTARPVAAAAVVVAPRELVGVAVIGHAPAIAPRPESIVAARAVVVPPARFTERPVVAKFTPAPPRVPFRAQQAALEANGGRPLDPAAMNRLRATAPAPAPAVRSAIRPVGGPGSPAIQTRQPQPGFRPGGTEAARPPINDRPPGAYDRPPAAEVEQQRATAPPVNRPSMERPSNSGPTPQVQERQAGRQPEQQANDRKAPPKKVQKKDEKKDERDQR